MKEGGNKMKLIMSLLEKYLMPFSNKITSNKLLNAIKDACILTSPFTVVGSLAGLVSQQANYWFGEWGIPLDGILGSIINAFTNINTVAMGLTGLVVVIASSYNYANQLKGLNKGRFVDIRSTLNPYISEILIALELLSSVLRTVR